MITKIGDHEIDNVFMTKVRDNLRLNFKYFHPDAGQGRQGPPDDRPRRQGDQVVEVPVTVKANELIQPLKGATRRTSSTARWSSRPPRPNSWQAIDRGSQPVLGAIGSPLALRRGDKIAFPGEELVIVSSPMFPHRIGKGYGNPMAKVVKEINGIKIKNLKHLVETLRDSKEKYITITFDDHATPRRSSSTAWRP